MIDGHVVRDLEQPARELELGRVAVDVVQRLDERVLRELLGGLAVAHHPEDEREHGPLVAANELPERGLAPSLGERDDIRVGEVGEIEGGSGTRSGGREPTGEASPERPWHASARPRDCLSQLVRLPPLIRG